MTASISIAIVVLAAIATLIILPTIIALDTYHQYKREKDL